MRPSKTWGVCRPLVRAADRVEHRESGMIRAAMTYRLCSPPRFWTVSAGGILLFGPCGAHPSVPARTFNTPSRGGAVKAACFTRPRGLGLEGPEHGGRIECVGGSRAHARCLRSNATGETYPSDECRRCGL